MDITCVVLSNGELAKISKEQRAARYEVWQTSLTNPDFGAFARSCGAVGLRVENEGDLAAAVTEALAHPGPALLEIVTDPALM